MCVCVILFSAVPNANPAAPEATEDNAIPSPSPPDQGRIGPEIPGNTGEKNRQTKVVPTEFSSRLLTGCSLFSRVQII